MLYDKNDIQDSILYNSILNEFAVDNFAVLGFGSLENLLINDAADTLFTNSRPVETIFMKFDNKSM